MKRIVRFQLMTNHETTAIAPTDTCIGFRYTLDDTTIIDEFWKDDSKLIEFTIMKLREISGVPMSQPLRQCFTRVIGKVWPGKE